MNYQTNFSQTFNGQGFFNPQQQVRGFGQQQQHQNQQQPQQQQLLQPAQQQPAQPRQQIQQPFQQSQSPLQTSQISLGNGLQSLAMNRQLSQGASYMVNFPEQSRVTQAGKQPPQIPKSQQKADQERPEGIELDNMYLQEEFQQFIDKFSDRDNYICQICQDILWDPESCSNCHKSFCKTCISQSLQYVQKNQLAKNKKRKCPSCNEAYQRRDFSKTILNGIKKLQFRCTNQDCDEVISYEKFPKHLVVCALKKDQQKIRKISKQIQDAPQNPQFVQSSHELLDTLPNDHSNGTRIPTSQDLTAPSIDSKGSVIAALNSGSGNSQPGSINQSLNLSAEVTIPKQKSDSRTQPIIVAEKKQTSQPTSSNTSSNQPSLTGNTLTVPGGNPGGAVAQMTPAQLYLSEDARTSNFRTPQKQYPPSQDLSGQKVQSYQGPSHTDDKSLNLKRVLSQDGSSQRYNIYAQSQAYQQQQVNTFQQLNQLQQKGSNQPRKQDAPKSGAQKQALQTPGQSQQKPTSQIPNNSLNRNPPAQNQQQANPLTFQPHQLQQIQSQQQQQKLQNPPSPISLRRNLPGEEGLKKDQKQPSSSSALQTVVSNGNSNSATGSIGKNSMIMKNGQLQLHQAATADQQQLAQQQGVYLKGNMISCQFCNQMVDNLTHKSQCLHRMVQCSECKGQMKYLEFETHKIKCAKQQPSQNKSALNAMSQTNGFQTLQGRVFI